MLFLGVLLLLVFARNDHPAAEKPKFNFPLVALISLRRSRVSPWAPNVTLLRVVFGYLWTLNPERSSCLRPLDSLSIGSSLESSKRPLSSIITVTKVSPDSPLYQPQKVVPSGPMILALVIL